MLDTFVVGVVRAVFGLNGRVKVLTFSGEIDHLEELETVVLRKDGVEKQMVIEETGGAPNSFFMKFKGIDTPEAAKSLTGWELVVSRDAAAYLDDNEFYVEDLRGIEVTLDGARIGQISDVVEGGGGQLIDIALDAGGSRLVPFRNEFFGDVDMEGRKIVLLAGWMLE
ncbi:MAG: ribosome maturation factor RimM [Treponemataceae bacterium]